jgi:hypothetical protein
MSDMKSFLKAMEKIKPPEPPSIGSQIGELRRATERHGIPITRAQMNMADLAAKRQGEIFSREQTLQTQRERERIGAEFPGFRRTLLDTSPELNRYVEMGNQLGPSRIEEMLRTSAERDLALGRTLSPEEERAANQAARSGFAARGMAHGTPSLAMEILNRDGAASAREAQRRAFAQGIDAYSQGRINSDRGFATQLAATMDPQSRLSAVLAPDSAAAANQTATGMIWNAGMNAANNAANMANAQWQTATGVLGSYYNAQMNNQWAQQANRANNRAGMISGGLGALGSIVGAFGGPIGSAIGGAVGNRAGAAIT